MNMNNLVEIFRSLLVFIAPISVAIGFSLDVFPVFFFGTVLCLVAATLYADLAKGVVARLLTFTLFVIGQAGLSGIVWLVAGAKTTPPPWW